MNLPVFHFHGTDTDLRWRFLASPAPYLLIDGLVKLDVVSLHVLGKVLANILNRTVSPFPPGHPACIPKGDNIDMFLHLFCHDFTPLTCFCASCVFSDGKRRSF